MSTLTVIKYLDRSTRRIGKSYYLADSSFVRGDAAEAERVETSVDLFDELQREEGENEGFVLEDNDEHVLAQFDSFDNTVEGDFSAVLPLVIVPNNHLVARRRQDQDDKV